MQSNDIDMVISNALQVNKDILSQNIKPIIIQIKKSLKNNKEAIKQTNIIDVKNNNGFNFDFDIVDNIFSNVEKKTILYGDTITLKKDENN